MDWRIGELFRNLFASEEHSSAEFNVIDPQSTDGSVNRITLAYIPPTEDLPTADVTLYWTDSDSKLFEKRFDSPEDALQAYQAIEADLQTVQSLTQSNKVEEAANVMSSLIQQYSTRTDDQIDNAVPVEGEVDKSADEQPTSKIMDVFQNSDMSPMDYVLSVAQAVFKQGSGPLDAQKLQKYMEAGFNTQLNPEEVTELYEKVKRHLFAFPHNNPLTKQAGATVQNLFFDTIEELQTYQEKMKELNPESDELPGDFDMDLGTSEEDPLGPPSQSYEEVEEEEADKEKMLSDRIEREVEEQVESQKNQMVSSTFGPEEKALVDAMRGMGRTYEEIREYFIKTLKFEEDSVNAYVDSLKGTPGDLHEPEAPETMPEAPKPEVSPEVHDKLVDEILEEEPEPEMEPELEEIEKEIEKQDMAIAEIEKQDGEIKKVAQDPLEETPGEGFESQEQFPKTEFPESEDDMDQTSLTTPMDQASDAIEEPTPGDFVYVASDLDSGQTGYTAVFVKKEVDGNEEYAVVKPKDKEAEVKVPLYRVTRATQKAKNRKTAALEKLWIVRNPSPGGSELQDILWEITSPQQLVDISVGSPQNAAEDEKWVMYDNPEEAKVDAMKRLQGPTAEVKDSLKQIKADLEKLEKEAGTWSLPDTGEKAQRLSDLLDSLKESENVNIDQLESEIYELFGDDQLFDALDQFGSNEQPHGAVVKSLIQRHLQKAIKHYETNPENFRKKWAPEALELLKGQVLTADQDKKAESPTHGSTPAAIRQSTKAIDQYNYSVDEYDMVNGTVKKDQVVKLRDTKMRMSDPTKLPFEKRDEVGNWVQITEEEFNSWLDMWKEENASRFQKASTDKEAAPPTTEEETKIVFKPELKKAPDQMRKKDPIPANEEIEAAYRRVQAAQQKLVEIDRIAAGIRAEAAKKIKQLEHDTGKIDQIRQFDNGVLELMKAMEPLKGEVIEVSDKLITYSELHTKEKAKFTYAQIINKVKEKFPEVEKYIEQAKNGLQSKAVPVFQKILEWFPKKSRLSSRDSIDISADIGSFFDELVDQLNQATKILQEIPDIR